MDLNAQTNNGNLSEKSFSRGLLLGVIAILLCMAAMAVMTWMWFRGNVGSLQDIVRVASAKTDVSVIDGAGAGIAPIEGNDHRFALDPAATYTVNLTNVGSAVASFCNISCNTGAYRFCTPDIAQNTGYAFTVAGVSDLWVLPNWGTDTDMNPVHIGALIEGQAVIIAPAPEATPETTPEATPETTEAEAAPEEAAPAE